MSEIGFISFLFVGGVFVGKWLYLKTAGFISQTIVTLVIVLVGCAIFLTQRNLTKIEMTMIVAVSLGIHLLTIFMMVGYTSFTLQWRTVLIASSAILGCIIFLLTIGVEIVKEEIALMSVATQVFGIQILFQLSNWLSEIGQQEGVALLMMLFSVQTVIGLPILSFCLRKESQRLLEKNKLMSGSNTYVSGIDLIDTSVWYTSFKTKTSRVLSLVLLVSIITIVLNVEVYRRTYVLGIVLVIHGIALGGSLLFALSVGKKFGYSIWLSAAISVNTIFGFPFSLFILNEVITSLASSEDQRKYLLEKLYPKIICSRSVIAILAWILFSYLLLSG